MGYKSYFLFLGSHFITVRSMLYIITVVLKDVTATQETIYFCNRKFTSVSFFFFLIVKSRLNDLIEHEAGRSRKLFKNLKPVDY